MNVSGEIFIECIVKRLKEKKLLATDCNIVSEIRYLDYSDLALIIIHKKGLELENDDSCANCHYYIDGKCKKIRRNVDKANCCTNYKRKKEII